MIEKELLALEWLMRCAGTGQHGAYARTIQDMLIERGVEVDMTERAPFRDGWPLDRTTPIR